MPLDDRGREPVRKLAQSYALPAILVELRAYYAGQRYGELAQEDEVWASICDESLAALDAALDLCGSPADQLTLPTVPRPDQALEQ